MKKTKTNSRKVIVFVVLAVIICCGFLAGAIWLLAKDQSTSNNALSRKPTFSLDTTKTPDWWTSGTRWPKLENVSDTIPQTLPVADMTVHATDEGAKYLDNCFVSFSFYDKAIDPSVALTDKIKQASTGSDTDQLIEIGTKQMSIDTATNTQSYQLHQFNFTANPENDVLRGMQFGFIPYQNGHIEVSSHCKTPESLSYTIPVLSAVKFTY